MTIIRPLTKADSDEVTDMMREFYSSPAVLTNGSDDIFKNDIENCVSGSPYLEGYVFCDKERVFGYAMVAKSFSTEFGKQCIWIEDLYIRPAFRGQGAATEFFKYICKKYPNCIMRLEADKNNEQALNMYKKCGFEVLPYIEMKKII